LIACAERQTQKVKGYYHALHYRGCSAHIVARRFTDFLHHARVHSCSSGDRHCGYSD
jgi:uncharacterized protein (DUF169 family)